MSKTIVKERGAVVLLSGGIDSTVCAYLAKRDIGEEGKLHALSFEYGQLHRKELLLARDLGAKLEVDSHPLIKVLGMELFGSSLVGRGTVTERLAVMKEAYAKEEEVIPSTWVPQRNSLFLALAFAYAETVGVSSVYIGVNSMDYSGYPDCRPDFILAMGKALNLASKQAVETGQYIGIVTPLQFLSKVEIIKKGTELGVDFSRTTSCYCGGELACGKCPSCLIRLEAFRELGMEDPLEYEKI